MTCARVMRVALLAFGLASLAASCLTATAPPGWDPATGARPAEWAAPVEAPGLPNLHRVDDGLWRGAQPSAEGIGALPALGVRTVVNLRTFHSDREPCRRAGLDCVQIPMQAWAASDDDLLRFLVLATDPERRPVLVHCKHGADRTGLACAVYRVVVQGWSKDAALAEMVGGEFGYHPLWDNLVEHVRELDVEAMRQRLEDERRARSR